MAFGRGGLGFGHLGRLGSTTGGAVADAGAALLLTNETDGLACDFTTSNYQVALKVGGVVSYPPFDTFFQNGQIQPAARLVRDAGGTLVWVPHNLFLNSNTPATQSVVTVVGATYTVSVWGSGSLIGSSGASGTAIEGSPLTYTATGTISTFTKSGTLNKIQFNQGRVATEYLATGATRRHGLTIDYHPTLGRTLLNEGGCTNLCLWSNDLTQSAWTKSNMTTAFTATGPTGFSNTATTLTATAGNATALQAITSASAARITTVYLKRRTGSGNVDLTQDNGSTWATQSITSSWARYTVAEATVANPTIGIRLVTSGDEVDVALFQNEVTTLTKAATSPLPSYAAQVARFADNYTFLLSTIPFASAYSIYVRCSIMNTVNASAIIAVTDGTTQEQAKLTFVATLLRLQVVDNGSTLASIGGSAFVADTLTSVAARFKLNDCAMSIAGGAAGTDTSVTMPSPTEVRFGGAGTNAGATNHFRITKLVIVPVAWDDATLVTKSGS